MAPFAFTPADGYRNKVSFPTTPASEDDFRNAMQSLLDQMRDELNSGASSAIGIQSMARQAIINGNFDVWQRGTSFTNPVTGQFTTDRFRFIIANTGTLPTSIIAQRLTLNPGELSGSFYAHRTNVNGAGGGFGASDQYSHRQEIEFGTRYLCGNGKKVTVSFYARSDIPGKRIGIALQQKYGLGGSPSAVENLIGQIITLTSSWTKYSVTFTTNTLAGKTFGTNNDDSLQAAFFYMWGTTIASNFFGGGTSETFVGAGNIDIAQVQVNAGDTSLPFQPRSFTEELALCQRYYEKSYPYSSTPGSLSRVGAHHSQIFDLYNLQTGAVKYRVIKRIAPTVTIFSSFDGAAGVLAEHNAGDTFVANRVVNVLLNGDNGFKLQGNNNLVANNQAYFHYASDAEL